MHIWWSRFVQPSNSQKINPYLMNKKLVFIFFLNLVFTYPKCQSIYNQTISSLGSSNLMDNSEFIIHQSIGQSSIVGNFNLQNIKVHQGFLKGIYPISKPLESVIILPYPNPFQEKLVLEFFPYIDNLIKVSVYDLNGKMVHQMDHKTKENKVFLDLKFLSSSVYLVLVSSGNQVFHTRIIKK